MNIYDCLRLPLGDVPADCIERFDCGREDINNFFRFLIVDAYNEPGLIQFYEHCGLKLFFTTEEQEKKYRNIRDREGEPPAKLETRLMFFDLINYNNEKV